MQPINGTNEIPNYLISPYEWIDSAGEWSEAIANPEKYAQETSENARSEGLHTLDASRLLEAIKWKVAQYDAPTLALARHLGADPADVEQSRYSDHVYECDGQEWFVLADSEADEQAREQIKDTLWAFNTSFLASYIPALNNPRAARAFDKVREELCEGANDLVSAMLGESLDRLIDDAISSDGRGHFLSSYDGEEVECGGFYLYRVN